MPYDNSQRAAAAASTRARVLASANELFRTAGFAATTIRAVADSAAVSPETIYKAFGSKAALLKSVYDVALAGDTEEVPLSERPEVRAVREAATPEASANAYAELARIVATRTDPLLRVLLRSQGSDPVLAEFAETTNRERLTGSRNVVEHWQAQGWLRKDLTVDRAAEIVWALNAPEPRWLLLDQGWTEPEFSQWLGESLHRAVLA